METDLPSNISKTSSVEIPIAGGLEPTKPISFLGLFRFCTPCELFLLFIGFIMSAIKALTLPAVVIIYSEFTAMLVDRTLRIGTTSQTYCLPIFGGGKILTNASIEENNQELYNDSISYGILLTLASIVMLISGILSVDIFNLIALRQVTRIRIKLFESVMRQNIGWHDLASKQNFAQNMIDDAEKIRDGISEKVGHFIYLVIGFIITVGISFAYGWKLTLAVSAYIPIVIVLNYFVAKFQSKLTMQEQECYAAAGNQVEEVLAGIRTVLAFGGQTKECQRYNNMLVPARKASQRKGAFAGFSDAVLKSMLFLTCAGAFWYGVNLIVDDRYVDDKEYTPAILMIAFFGIIIGADNIARTSPFLESFAIARGSATTLFRVIESNSKIDPLSTDGKILNYGLRGDVDFVDVFFRYPARPDMVIHRGLNIKIKAGTMVALVGPSGCGKSTCLQLLQRFYDPVFGSIMLDDLDIRKYNIQWLRSNMAVVGQEPVLFMGTIAENISYGLPHATQKDIETAAKSAGVHDFISNLPQSYKTVIGERGCQLSGGQKQRIAIARALIQKPKILLLDEATSALDYQAEKLVQKALDFAAKGRTTIVISHRLSAIRNADKIFFIQDGRVLEEGSHNDLMALEGAYYQMVKAGNLNIPAYTEEINETNEDNKQNSLALYEKSFETSPVNLGRNDPTTQNIPDHTLDSNHTQHGNSTENIFEPKQEDNRENYKEFETNFFITFGRILKIAKPEMYILIVGGVCAIIYGFTYPLFSVAFGEFYAALAEVDVESSLNRTAALSICCVVLSVLTAVSSFLQTYLFNYAGVWLTTRLRSTTFKAMMSQEMAWYDDAANSVGVLSARLSGDAAGVQGAIGYPLSGIIQALSNFLLGLTLAFYYSWKLALLCLSTCPIIIGSVIFEAKFMSNSLMLEKKILEKASRIATEAITNIRTIAGLRREQYIINEYNIEMQHVQTLIREKLKYRGIINASGQAFLFFAYAIALCYGGVLVSEGKIEFQDVIKVSETLLYGFMMLAQSLAFAPSFTAALVAGHRLFAILDRRKRQISHMTTTTSKTAITINKPKMDFEGVSYQDVTFRYPTRSELKVLNSFNLDIQQNQTVGLVGHSGSGKSTCVQLLQRFYELNRGNIYINENDIHTDLSVENVRSRLGIVAQEPVLFARTIAENIAYGDNKRELSMAEIISAAKTANAHGFISSLPNGYETKIGSHGSHLSGGQKQRIAIARALIRNPHILLLDEATSALDVQSEQLVQQALDVATTGRTCIIIAHRLSTIQNANLICVLDKGSIVEQGTHQELLARNGIYARLYNIQRTTAHANTS